MWADCEEEEDGARTAKALMVMPSCMGSWLHPHGQLSCASACSLCGPFLCRAVNLNLKRESGGSRRACPRHPRAIFL